MSNREPSLEKLLAYQQDLQLEKEWLEKVIKQLNQQADALQVEKLHILNAINEKKQPCSSKTTTNQAESNLKNKSNEIDAIEVIQELDLTVPVYQSFEEDEDEIDE